MKWQKKKSRKKTTRGNSMNKIHHLKVSNQHQAVMFTKLSKYILEEVIQDFGF
jgi:hypothetical protein